ncbi:hypothetical protein EVB14_00030 [Neisseria meningitidis]|nr:hypothetical protein [Neisseria meningitidis]
MKKNTLKKASERCFKCVSSVSKLCQNAIYLWLYVAVCTGIDFKILQINQFIKLYLGIWLRTVNPQVPGSSPGRGARILKPELECSGFFIFARTAFGMRQDRFSNGFAVKFCLSDFGFLLCPSKS